MRFKSLFLSRACWAVLAVLAVLAALPTAAQAQSTDDAEKLDRLQRQLEQLQDQMRTLKGDMAQAKKKANELQAAGGAYAADLPTKAPYVKAPPAPAGVKLSWGGFIAAEGVWRQRSEAADVNSDYNNIPYPISPLYHENETRFSARQSRLFFLAEGNISMSQIVRGYFEMDFLGAATTANSIESNSYTPRTRNIYMTYDDMAAGWHVLAGQNWSLLTQNRNGIVPRQENIPLTIDAQAGLVGFTWTRNPQFRVVGDVAPGVAIAASAESPQIRFQTPGSTAPPGITVSSTNQGTQSGLMDTLQTYSLDTIPDFIEKVAFDPGFGHYEVIGLQRFFTDRTLCTSIAFGNCPGVGTASNKTTFGWGVGGNFLLPAVPQFLDLQGSIIYGQGTGRYGSGQLPDVTYAADGSLTPITAVQAMAGAVAHATPALDFYVYAGLEKDDAKYGSLGGTNFGFGNPLYSDSTCFTESFTGPAASAAGSPGNPITGLLSNTGCSVNVKQLAEITAGLWYNFYKGPMGRIAGGLQYEYIRRDTLPGTFSPGVLVTPSTNESIVLTSLRYYFP